MPQVDQWRKHADARLHEIRNLIEHLVAGDASSPIEGQHWYNSVTKRWRFRDDATTRSVAWLDEVSAGISFDPPGSSAPGDTVAEGVDDDAARADHRHGREAHGTAQHSGFSLSDFAAPSADLSIGNHKLTNLTDPTAAQDAVTKAYADGLKAGLLTKQPARLATAAALPAHTRSGNVLTASANGALSVDGTAAANGDRVLVKNEGATHLEHGWYDVTDLGSAGTPWVLTRADDADAGAELRAGAASWIVSGTANGGTRWVLSTPVTGTPTLNTTALGFTLDFAAVAATAGAGMVDEGASIGVGEGYGVDVTADAVAVDKALVPTFYSALIGGAGPAVSYTVTNAGWAANDRLLIQIIEVATGYDVTRDLGVHRQSDGDFDVEFDADSVAGTAFRYVLVALPA